MKRFGLFLHREPWLSPHFHLLQRFDDGGRPQAPYGSSPPSSTLDGGRLLCPVRDDGETLYPGDKVPRPGSYKPEPDKTQRVVIWFNLLQNGSGRITITTSALYYVDRTSTRAALRRVVTDPSSELDALGRRQNRLPGGNPFNLTTEWLTFNALYPGSDSSKHTCTVTVNEVNDDGEPADGGATNSPKRPKRITLQLEMRHNPGGDTQGDTDGYYVSFNLTPLAERLEGKKGVVLHIETNKNGPQEIKLDLPQKK